MVIDGPEYSVPISGLGIIILVITVGALVGFLLLSSPH